MLKRFLVYLLTGAATLGSVPYDAPAAGDHLVPVNPAFDESDLGAAYRKLYERKLLLTSGEVARFIFLPVLRGEERTASVYRVSGRKDALPGDYWVTATRPSVYLWEYVNPRNQGKMDSRTITVRRRDAPLPESTARAIHRIWLAMLVGTRPLPANEMLGESDTMIFSATNTDETLLRAQAQGFSEKTRRLIELGDGLVQYCDVPASDRATVARKIEAEASALLTRVAKSERVRAR